MRAEEEEGKKVRFDKEEGENMRSEGKERKCGMTSKHKRSSSYNI